MARYMTDRTSVEKPTSAPATLALLKKVDSMKAKAMMEVPYSTKQMYRMKKLLRSKNLVPARSPTTRADININRSM